MLCVSWLLTTVFAIFWPWVLLLPTVTAESTSASNATTATSTALATPTPAPTWNLSSFSDNETTTILSPISAGSTVLEVGPIYGWGIGDKILIGDEENMIAGFGSIVLAWPTAATWPAGTSVYLIQQDAGLGSVAFELNPSTPTTGTTPTSIKIHFTFSSTAPAAGTIILTASFNQFVAGTPSISVTNGPIVTSASATPTTLTVNLASVTAGTYHVMTIPATALAAYPVANEAVTWSLSGTVGFSDPVSGPAVVYTTVPVSAASDPVTFFGDQKFKFWLPVGEFTNLMETPDLIIFASTFQGPSEDLQWFERFLVTRPAPSFERVVQVTIRRPQSSFNATGSRIRSLRELRRQQLDVRLGVSDVPMRFDQDVHFGTIGGIQVGFFSRHLGMRSDHGVPLTEFVQVQSPSISFVIHASHAGNEFREDAYLRAKFAHLDMLTLHMVGVDNFVGVLPEIWGVRARSPEVSEMLVAPSKRKMKQACFEEMSSGPRYVVA